MTEQFIECKCCQLWLVFDWARTQTLPSCPFPSIHIFFILTGFWVYSNNAYRMGAFTPSPLKMTILIAVWSLVWPRWHVKSSPKSSNQSTVCHTVLCLVHISVCAKRLLSRSPNKLTTCVPTRYLANLSGKFSGTDWSLAGTRGWLGVSRERNL